MKAHFEQLYRYNQWANGLFGAALKANDYKHEKIDVFFSHILAAELIWLNRIEKVDVPVPGVWEKLPLEEAIERLAESSRLWLEFIDRTEGFDRNIAYQNTRGDSFVTLLKDIITHVANHGTHHRAQIALLLRNEGIDPPASDFIFFLRSQKQ